MSKEKSTSSSTHKTVRKATESPKTKAKAEEVDTAHVAKTEAEAAKKKTVHHTATHTTHASHTAKKESAATPVAASTHAPAHTESHKTTHTAAPVAPTAPAPAAPTPIPTTLAPAPAKTASASVPIASTSAPTAPIAAAPSATAPVAAPTSKIVIMKPPIVVKDLATKLGLKPFQLIHELMELNIFATLTQSLEEDIARKICIKKGFTFEIEKRERGAGLVHAPVKVVEPPKPAPPKPAELQARPPVITIMGHVDHGKTSLLDAIRSTRVAEGEAGGITQHIGAYTVKRGNQSITFLDTPGHAAFTSMRARGAKVTDIVILVVAADDSLMPQTLEAISHARAAKVPIIVAINKIDLPGANTTRVKAHLQEQGLVPEEYGGDTIVCEVSATRKIGIEKLLEMMLLQAEILELKAKPNGSARGVIIESQIEQGRGPTASVLIQEGTLRIGDNMLCGSYYGRVKALVNDIGKSIKEAGPSTPVKILGLNGVPIPGDILTVLGSEKEAREISEERAAKLRLGKLEAGPRITLENLFETIADGQRKVLKIVLKGDVQGSVEAIVGALKKIESKKIDLEIVHAAVGPISESDILLAKASQAIVIGFNTKTDNSAANAAKRENVQIKLFSIIYELIDQVKEAMVGMLDPELRETQIGTAVVKQVFKLSKFPVAGCSVATGRIARTARARVIRRKQPIYDGGIQTLKRFQDEASEVRAGLECGIRLGDFNDYEEGDIIECYLLEKFAQAL
jgi:translation initiation factor IF-2